jgi:septin 7
MLQVNIVPLIAKADTMTPDECHDFKKEILREIQMHNINIYEFPDVSDEEENRLQKKLKQRVPFAVIGSNVVLQINDRRIRARQYPWVCKGILLRKIIAFRVSQRWKTRSTVTSRFCAIC